MATIDKFFYKKPKLTDNDHQQDTARPQNLLRTLIRRIRQHDLSEYQTALDRGDEIFEQKVTAFLRPELVELYETGKLCQLGELRKLSQKDSFRHRKSSVYLHVIVTPEGVRFYIGQADDTQKRVISQHQSESYRNNNASLHYKALETSTEDFFVDVGVLPDAVVGDDLKVRALDLNTFEMWGALIFRSLPRTLLQKYLPASIANDKFSDLHLNLRSPLSQSKARDDNGWHQVMQSSTDPLKIERYADFKKSRTEQLQKMTSSKNAKTMQDAMLGERRSVCKSKGATRVQIKGLKICVPMLIKPYEDNTVHFKLDMQPADEGDHPHYYVRNAPEEDVCRRLGIQFTGLGPNGDELTLWASTETKSDNIHKTANSLCDFLLDIPIEVTEQTPRRFLDVNKGRGRPNKVVYT
jgi:hypothetical protein